MPLSRVIGGCLTAGAIGNVGIYTTDAVGGDASGSNLRRIRAPTPDWVVLKVHGVGSLTGAGTEGTGSGLRFGDLQERVRTDRTRHGLAAATTGTACSTRAFSACSLAVLPAGGPAPAEAQALGQLFLEALDAATGAPVTDLQPGDFVVEEDGRRADSYRPI